MAAAKSLSARWEVRLRVSRPRPGFGPVLLLSLGLHLAVVLVLLVAPRSKPPDEPMLSSPVAMVFQPPNQGARSAPTPSRQSTPPPAPPVPALPPPPPAPPQPAAPAPPVAPPQPATPAPPPQLAPARQTPAPTPPPMQAQAVPQSAAPAPAIEPAPALPAPPPAAPRTVATNVPLRLPPPPPEAPPRPTPEPHRPPTAFPAPTTFSLGRPLVPTPSVQRSPPPGAGPAAKGALSFGQFARVVAGHVDPSWLDELHHWWDRHAYYPDQAAANGEDGSLLIRIVVDRYGHVQSVQRQTRSGSVWLDMAAVGTFRNASLPPLPPDTSDPTITLDLSINYVLLRH